MIRTSDGDVTRMLALTVACLAGTVADIARTAACMPCSPDTIAALGRAERACLALEAQVRAMDLMSLDDASGKELG
ncbi:hypothetical protein [Pseudoscardovia suis]